VRAIQKTKEKWRESSTDNAPYLKVGLSFAGLVCNSAIAYFKNRFLMRHSCLFNPIFKPV
jgi:hypothetical protein